MPTVTIELTDQEHDRLTAAAAREGRSVGEVVKNRALPDAARYEADMAALGDFLEERIRRMRRDGGVEIAEGGLYEHLEARARDRER